MRKIILCNFVLIFFCIPFKSAYAQKENKILFGFNITHFGDWKNKPLNFFNPEIIYSKSLSKRHNIQMVLNGLYSQATSKDIQTTGSVFQRLIFSYDIGFEQKFKNFSLGIGPSLRYRNEKKVVYLPQSNPFDFLIDPNKSHFDIGGFANLKYEIVMNKKSFFNVKLTYRIYNKGVNPISLGLFYGRLF